MFDFEGMSDEDIGKESSDDESRVIHEEESLEARRRKQQAVKQSAQNLKQQREQEATKSAEKESVGKSILKKPAKSRSRQISEVEKEALVDAANCEDFDFFNTAKVPPATVEKPPLVEESKGS